MASRLSQGFIHQAMPLTNTHHTLLSWTVLLACLTSNPFFFKQSVLNSINPPLPRPTKCATTSTLSYIAPLSNLIVIHSLHMTNPSENINFSVHTLRLSAKLFVHLYSPNPRSNFSFHHCLTVISKKRYKMFHARLAANP